MDLRCDHKKHAVLLPNRKLEIKCSSRFCGAGQGVVVIHRYDLSTGKLENTQRYREPNKEKE